MSVNRAHGVWMGFCALVLLTGGAWAEVVGKSAEPLSSEKVREAECSLGDLVADAARAAGNADLALVQASQLRQTTIPAGDLTRDALTGALLYPDERVVVVTISGAQVRAALEHLGAFDGFLPRRIRFKIADCVVTILPAGVYDQRLAGA